MVETGRMLSPNPELVWQGRIHLGDEPGVYGDASYAGLSLELPLTLTKTHTAGHNVTTLVLITEDVQTFSGYPGHLITVTSYSPDFTDPDRWQETLLTSAWLTSSDDNEKEIDVDLAGQPSPTFLSLRVRIDTEVPVGLYDDFLITKLLNSSPHATFVASLGFKI
jgi:hypothetical protein